jgi:hypothetical protein
MSIFARLRAGDPPVLAKETEPVVQPPSPSHAVEELSIALREARGKARALRQRGRVLQREGSMKDALSSFRQAEVWQERADKLEHERALIRRYG